MIVSHPIKWARRATRFRPSGGAPYSWWSASLVAIMTAEPLQSIAARPTRDALRPMRAKVSGSMPSSPTNPGSPSSSASVSHLDSWSAPRIATTP